MGYLRDLNKKSLQGRILITVMTLGFVAGCVTIIQNVFFHNHLIEIILTSCVTFLTGLAIILCVKTGRYEWYAFPVLILVLSLLVVLWMWNGGTEGGVSYFFFVMYVAGVLSLPKNQRFIFLILTTTALFTCFGVELFYPEYIAPYKSLNFRFWDISISMVLSIGITVGMVSITFGYYLREHLFKEKSIRQVTRQRDRIQRETIKNQRMLSMVSHDIANAVSAIQGSLELIKIECKSPDQDGPFKYMNKIEFCADNITEIIDSVKALQSYETGKKEIKMERVSVSQLLDRARLLFVERLSIKNMRLVSEITKDNDFYVKGELASLSNHVINNLISNALKFSFAGSEIRVSAKRAGQKLFLYIEDFGIGIPKNILESLFDMRTKTHRPGTQGEIGTGFGMPLVKTLVTLYGGKINITSKTVDDCPNDHGTCVQIILNAA